MLERQVLEDGLGRGGQQGMPQPDRAVAPLTGAIRSAAFE